MLYGNMTDLLNILTERKTNKAAYNNGLAKNLLTEVIELLFCYFALVSAEGSKFSR